MKNENLNIFLVSFLMLFLEMFLIRWISTEIRIFAYVSNLALLSCELTHMLSGFSDFVIWFETFSPNKLIPVMEGIFLTISIFAGTVIVFVPIGQILGNLLDKQKDIILAYSLNVSASILGIWFSIYNREKVSSIFLFGLFTLFSVCANHKFYFNKMEPVSTSRCISKPCNTIYSKWLCYYCKQRELYGFIESIQRIY